MAFVNHIIPRGKRDFWKINLWGDISHCILYVKLQSLWDTPKYNAIIKILCTEFFYYDWNHFEGWHIPTRSHMHTLCIYAYTHTCIHYYIHTYVGRDNTTNRSYLICSCTKVCECKYASDANVQNVIKAHSPHH